MTEKKILDIGCGEHCLPGAVGMDIRPFPGVVAHDLCKGPYPFEDNSFKHIRCQHVIEHIQNLPLFAKEVFRICAPNATIEFKTPHYSSYASWGDPTHFWHFALGSIPQLFDQNIGKENYTLIQNKIKFTGSFFDIPGRIIYKLSPKRYEKYFAWRYPANEIVTILRFKKD